MVEETGLPRGNLEELKQQVTSNHKDITTLFLKLDECTKKVNEMVNSISDYNDTVRRLKMEIDTLKEE